MSHKKNIGLHVQHINKSEGSLLKQRLSVYDLFWSYLAQALNIGAGLFLLPVALRYLSQEDIGLWFVFLTIGGLAQLLELGFQPIISRNTSYVFAGAKMLTSVGVPESFDTSQKIDPYLLAQLIAACRLIYRGVALAASFVLIIGGSLYILELLTPGQEAAKSILAWIFYAFGSIANFYFGYVNALLQGRGDVSAANKATVTARITMLILGIAALSAGMGLLGLGIAMFFSSFLSRFVALRALASEFATRAALKLANSINGRLIAKTLWHNASRLGIVNISAFLIQRSNILIASSFLGLSVASSFSFTVTILMILSSVSMVIVQIRLPHLAYAHSHADSIALRTIYGELVIIGWSTYIVGFFTLLFLAPSALALIGAKTSLLPHWQFLIYGAILALEMNHSIAATYLTTRNITPFFWSSLLSGLAILILSITLVERYQVWGLIAAQGITQLIYNNWKWPRVVRKQLGFSWASLLNTELSRFRHICAKRLKS